MRERFVGFYEHPGGEGDASEHDEVQRCNAGGALELPGKIERAQCCLLSEGLDREVALQVILDILHDTMNTLQQVFHFSLATCDHQYVKNWTRWLI